MAKVCRSGVVCHGCRKIGHYKHYCRTNKPALASASSTSAFKPPRRKKQHTVREPTTCFYQQQFPPLKSQVHRAKGLQSPSTASFLLSEPRSFKHQRGGPSCCARATANKKSTSRDRSVGEIPTQSRTEKTKEKANQHSI